MADALSKVDPLMEEDDYQQKKQNEEPKEEEKKEKFEIVFKMNTRLDNPVFDLWVSIIQAIFILKDGVAHLFREYLDSKNFIEIHSPKLIGGAPEGGLNVFKFKYFNQDVCLV